MSNTSYQSFLGDRDLKQVLADIGVAISDSEEWKYGNYKSVTGGSFVPCNTIGRSSSELRPFVPQTTGISLVFVNGKFRENLSAPGNLPTGVRLITMFSAADSDKFGTLAAKNNSPFTALNVALGQKCFLLELPAGTALEQTVNIIHLTDGDAGGSVMAQRNLIVAGAGSKASIVEYYTDCGLENGAVLNLPVTEIFCGADTEINHLKIVQENGSMHHLGSTCVQQDKDSRFTSQEFALKGGCVRRELHLQLAGEGASCDLKALSMGRASQQVDMRTRVDHLVAGCSTSELYKGILDDNSRGIFDGLIKVAPDAQQTSAHQTNRTLVLSDNAVAYSIPRLEIYADDVKCSHGSTTGQLEDEQIFFLRSRGFTEEKARTMLAAAFAREIVLSVSDPMWRKVLDLEISSRLTQPSSRRIPHE